MDKLKKVLKGEEEDEGDQSLYTQFSEATTLSWSTRLKGFVICFVLGMVLSFIGVFVLFLGSTGLVLFSIFYTLGNIVAMLSTCFLMGPLRQLKNMFSEKRIIATIVVIITFVLTLCAGLWWGIPVLALVFCILQFLALTWYALSYIPFARDAVKKCFGSCMA
uniref:Vesicle transport protein n=1 Tax=Saccoglossus kowalevskii TaxID=10224 RepID=A0ABM0MZM0_SACKO|nr:PREDICTED: vesicle transport protein SFT2B-like [Saccoglossus kowalevskii]